jgi:sugar/nucleoside kinase (ribokinase family)
LRVLVAGFVTIDTIQLSMRQVMSVGGPPSYAGLICSRFGNDVVPLTRVGADFPDDQAVWLARNGVVLRATDRSASRPTTRFSIENSAGARTLRLTSRCDDISPSQIPPDTKFNAALVSPLAGEVSGPLLGEIAARSEFVFLDPQGFIRSFGADGTVSFSPPKDLRMLAKVNAIKMDKTEAEMITGKRDPVGALEKLSSLGVRKGIVTQGADSCHVLDGSKVYRVGVPKVPVIDSTGAGDILSGATVSWYLRSRDFLRSACFGIAASSLSLQMIALGKVDLPMSVDETAARLYSAADPVGTVRPV